MVHPGIRVYCVLWLSSGDTWVKPKFLFLFYEAEIQHATEGLYYRKSGSSKVLWNTDVLYYEVHKWPQPFALKQNSCWKVKYLPSSKQNKNLQRNFKKMSNEEWDGKPEQQCSVICETVTEVLNPKQNVTNILIKYLCFHIIFS
jgi:hypothetical protein